MPPRQFAVIGIAINNAPTASPFDTATHDVTQRHLMRNGEAQFNTAKADRQTDDHRA
ncbi:hypothetical protein [Rhodopirellula baltica]